MEPFKDIEGFGRVQLLSRQNGISEPMQIYDINDIASAMNVIRKLPFVPTSHKTLLIPSIAELYDEDDGHNLDGVNNNNNVQPIDFGWLDVECDDDAVIKGVLSLFPVHSSTKKDVQCGSIDAEIAEVFPSCGYVCINVNAKRDIETLSGQDDDPVMVSMIAFEQFLLTIHRGPLAGAGEMREQMERMVSSPTSYAEPVSVFVCSLISCFVKRLQKEPSSLLVDVDNVNEMVLQIQPSQCDQMDLLRRIENLRHRLSRLQALFLAKERLVQQLLLPVMRRIFISTDPSVVYRYQRLLSGLLLSIERLRKGRDVLNVSGMALVSGVSMRLLQHCYWMDFLNNVMTQMSLITMPICIIPGLFSMNVRVPFEDSEGLTAFVAIALISLVVFILGMAYPTFLYIRYKPPGALLPSSLS